MSETNNFQESIHNEAYKQKFLPFAATCGGMVCDAGREKESLNGLWNFCIDPYDTCLRQEWYKEERTDPGGRALPVDFDFDAWEKVSVPSCWNTGKPEYFHYDGPGVYTRTFGYANRGEKKVYLKFGAANYEATVFLNKKTVGHHLGGSTPFYIDVTGVIEASNRLTVVVDSTRRHSQVPANNTDWYNYGGLYRGVELLRLPETFVRDFRIHLKNGSDFQKIEASVRLSEPIDCAGGLRIPELQIDVEFDVRGGVWQGVFDASPELWSPKTPKLYPVELSCGEDTVFETVGFREIKAVGTDILLNGKKIFLKGVSCHEESVENGKAVTEKEIAENLKLAKDLGCNYMRLAHYPHNEKAARLADEIGIMLWEEIPVYWAIDFENPETLRDAENQLTELIRRDANRASVIIWSVGNENADSDARLRFMKTLAETARAEDSSRLVSAACLVDQVLNKIVDRLADSLDIIGINEYYGWYDPDFARLPACFENSVIAKPVVISEFGADALAGHRGAADELFSEDMQKSVYEKQVETIRRVAYIKGMSPWILYDFRCPRRHNRFQQGYNRKGLLSPDKKHKKLAYFTLKEFYASIR